VPNWLARLTEGIESKHRNVHIEVILVSGFLQGNSTDSFWRYTVPFLTLLRKARRLKYAIDEFLNFFPSAEAVVMSVIVNESLPTALAFEILV
jgi:hypothetical protein